MEKNFEKICYQPGVFLFISQTGYCTKMEISPWVKELHLGEQTKDKHLNFNLDEENGVFPNITKLVIEAGAGTIIVKNTVFPNVQRVESHNDAYESRDDRLFVSSQNGLCVLKNVFNINSKEPIDLTGVDSIAAYAFYKCKSTTILNCKLKKPCQMNAFFGSAILEQPYQNGVITAGSILVAVDYDADQVVFPPKKAGIKYILNTIDMKRIKKLIIQDATIINKAIYAMPEMVVLDDTNCTLISQVQNITKLNGIKYIEIGPHCKNFISKDGIAYTKSGFSVIACPSERTGEVVIPEGVKIIEINAFRNTRICSVKLPDSLVSIREKAFDSCFDLKHVDFGNGIKHIGSASAWYAFFQCGLEEIEIPMQVTEIGYGAFWGCNLKKIILHDGLKVISQETFGKNKPLHEIVLPDTVTELGDYAFRGINIIHTKKYIDKLVASAIEPNVFAEDSGYVELDINGTSFIIPRHLKKDENAKDIEKIIKNCLNGICDETDTLYSYARTVTERQDVAIKIYQNTKSEKAKKFIKKHAKNIAKRLMQEEDSKRIIEFLKLGLLSKCALNELHDAAENKTDVMAYILQITKEKGNTGKSFTI